ncbi:MAG: hypothetical protein N3F11_10620 [Casimicrobiaceae bacterium]|nr:hypothetical protein [Casimicrobiaceae bacterium]
MPLLLWRGRIRWRDAALECYGPGCAWFLRGPWFRLLSGGVGYAAASIGQLIIGCDAQSLDRCHEHERAHVRQAERWGLFFPIAYIVAGVGAIRRAGSLSAFYWDNPFEIEARQAETKRQADMMRHNR